MSLDSKMTDTIKHPMNFFSFGSIFSHDNLKISKEATLTRRKKKQKQTEFE